MRRNKPVLAPGTLHIQLKAPPLPVISPSTLPAASSQFGFSTFHKRGRLLDFECTTAAWDTRRRSANAELVTGAVVRKLLTHAGRAREVISSADLTAKFCRSRRTPEGHRRSRSPKLQPKRHVSSSRTSKCPVKSLDGFTEAPKPGGPEPAAGPLIIG